MLNPPKGMVDLVPPESSVWRNMEEELRRILETYGYGEVRTPILEGTELFTRSVGTSSDIVEKEMFSFRDKGDDHLSLRPEGTAPVLRAYLNEHLGHGRPLVKLYYIGPMFRHERPQKGRLRQFHQIGVEAIGSAHPLLDVEVLAVVAKILHHFAVPNFELDLNSVGDENCRPAYREKLQGYLRRIETKLCGDCRRRIEVNPLRVFDCKVDGCREALVDAPVLMNSLCTGCSEHFDGVRRELEALTIPFCVNPRIVRGLDYYTRTAFEFTAGGLGAQNAIAAGGRYDGLAEELGGPTTPAVGFAMGLERLRLSSTLQPTAVPPRVEFVALDTAAETEANVQAVLLRDTLVEAKISATVDFMPGATSLKSALRRADKMGTTFVVLIGAQELERKKAMVKNLAQHLQEEESFQTLAAGMVRRLRAEGIAR